MRTKIFSLAGFIFALSLLAGCGGGGGSNGGAGCGSGAECVTFTFDGSSVVLPEKPSNYNGYNDPDIYTYLTSGGSGTVTNIVARSEYDPATSYDKNLKISIVSTSTGTFASTNGVVYSSQTGSSYTSTTSTFNVTRYDSSLGGRIQGSFDATMCEWPDIVYPGPTCKLGATTKHITGTFDVSKDNF